MALFGRFVGGQLVALEVRVKAEIAFGIGIINLAMAVLAHL